RTKEHAHDYRYFPDPDLMPAAPTDAWLAEVKSRVVELPLARKQRFMRDYGLPAGDAQTFVWDVPLGKYFEQAVKGSKNPKAIANWVINNLRALMTLEGMHEKFQSGEPPAPDGSVSVIGFNQLRFKPESINELVELVDGAKINNKIAQEVFKEMFFSGKSP